MCEFQFSFCFSNSRWSENGSSMVVKPVLAEGCLSVGDALREIDTKSLIKNDFFLVSGDVIANLNLKAIMEEHKYDILLLTVFAKLSVEKKNKLILELSLC